MSECWRLQFMPDYQLLEILAENSKLDDNFHFSIQVETNRNLYPLPSFSIRERDQGSQKLELGLRACTRSSRGKSDNR